MGIYRRENGIYVVDSGLQENDAGDSEGVSPHLPALEMGGFFERLGRTSDRGIVARGAVVDCGKEESLE